jgi:hypothetical protein
MMIYIDDIVIAIHVWGTATFGALEAVGMRLCEKFDALAKVLERNKD